MFIHSSVDGCLDSLHVLTIVNGVAMNIGVHVSFRIMLFSEYMPSSGEGNGNTLQYSCLEHPRDGACSPWCCEESDTTEWLHFHFSLSCIGEGNGNPLQCSCLENPRDDGAWWVAIYGVSQNQTRLKWLSSSSSSNMPSSGIAGSHDSSTLDL